MKKKITCQPKNKEKKRKETAWTNFPENET